MSKIQELCNSTKDLSAIHCCTQSKIFKTSFTWAIENFQYHPKASALSSNAYPSDNGNYTFTLTLNPEKLLTIENINCKYVSISINVKSASSVSTRLEFYVLSKTHAKRNVRIKQCVFSPSIPTAGLDDFISWELLDKSPELLPNGHLTVGCDISVLGDVQPVTLPSVVKNVIDSISPDPQLTQDLGALLENRKCSDVVLRVKDETFHAHMAFLSARSQVFAAMFEHELEEKSNNIVDITDMKPTVFKVLLRYIYTGCVQNVEITADLLIAADKYSILKLKTICEDVLSSRINIENVASLFVLADIPSAQKLKSSCIDFIISHISDVAKTDGWSEMLQERPNLTVDLLSAIALIQE